MRKTLAYLIFPLFWFPAALFAQNTDNTLYVRQFPGATVGDKVTKAQAACNPDTSIPCIIVFDPSLVKYAQGTLPAQCAQCQWMDYRGGLPYVAAGAGTGYGTKAPFLDVTTFGAKCDGTTDDSTAIQSALNVWKLGGKLLTNPTGATCVINSNLTVTWNASPSGPLTIDTRGGKWLFKATSGTDFHLVIGATNVYVTGLNFDHANFEDANSGASVLVDVDGSILGSTGLSKVALANASFKVDGYTTTAFQTENTFQGSCTNSGFYAPYASMSAAVEGHYGFYLRQPGSGQVTADWTLIRCESFGFDHGVYANNVNEVKIISGTYLQAFEENVYLNGASTLDQVHSENAWFQNPSGLPSAPTQMASVQCQGYCFVRDLTTANETVAGGNQNASVLVFAGAGQTAKIEGGLAFSTETTFAYVGTGVGAEIDLTQPAATNYVQYTGSGGIFPMNSASFYSKFFSTDQNANFQWIQTGAASSNGYIAFGKYDTPNGFIPAIYFAEGQGGFWVVGGYAVEQGNTAHFFKCSNLTGTPPNLGTPTGCTDGALGSSTSLLSDVTSLCRSDGTHCPATSSTVIRTAVITSGICTTPGTSYGTCSFTPATLWSPAFADTGYSVTCTPSPATSKAVALYVGTKTTGTATITLQNGTSDGAVATTVGEIDCTAIHP